MNYALIYFASGKKVFEQTHHLATLIYSRKNNSRHISKVWNPYLEEKVIYGYICLQGINITCKRGPLFGFKLATFIKYHCWILVLSIRKTEYIEQVDNVANMLSIQKVTPGQSFIPCLPFTKRETLAFLLTDLLVHICGWRHAWPTFPARLRTSWHYFTLYGLISHLSLNFTMILLAACIGTTNHTAIEIFILYLCSWVFEQNKLLQMWLCAKHCKYKNKHKNNNLHHTVYKVEISVGV